MSTRRLNQGHTPIGRPAGAAAAAGSGLAIAQGIVEAHRGRVRAESPPGEGATFSFALPLARG